ncbi:MAG: prephenate dehydrogenase/arogenate dehydrogenase family protein [Candidatus Omnitrophota bacterium]
MKLKKVVIIGTGLIGGSIGKALLERGLADEVVGVCRRQSTLERTLKEKAVSTGFVDNYEEACKGAEVIFVATPIHTIKDNLEALAGVLSGNVIVTDAGSTKKEIVAHAARFKDKFSFVGGHPLAGSEKTGVEHARQDLFENSLCVLTRDGSTKEEDLEKVSGLWQAMGAEVDIIAPEKHDEILAFTSHLPHVLAYSLTGVQKKEYFKYMSTGFKDATRIASSSADIWSDIFISNPGNVLKSIERFREVLAQIEDDIRRGRKEKLSEKLQKYREMRDEIS